MSAVGARQRTELLKGLYADFPGLIQQIKTWTWDTDPSTRDVDYRSMVVFAFEPEGDDERVASIIRCLEGAVSGALVEPLPRRAVHHPHGLQVLWPLDSSIA